jgi:hypothetical protein
MIKDRFSSIKSYLENIVAEEDENLRAEIAEEITSELDKMEDLVDLLDEGDDGDPETWASSLSENLELLMEDED